MKRVIKWVVGIPVVCFTVFLGLIIILPMVLDPNDYKGTISDLVYKQSGFRLEIPGDITLQISPRLDVLFSLGQIRVLSTQDSSDLPLLSSEEARVELSLLPLIKDKRLVIQGVKLHGVYCSLIRDTSGRGNWEVSVPAASQDASSSSPKKKEQADSTPSVQGKDKGGKIPGLELGAIDISRLTLRFEDKQAKKVFEVKNLSLQTGHVLDGQSFHLQSKFLLTSSGDNNSALFLDNSLNTDITFGLSEKTLQLDNIALHTSIKAFGIQDSSVEFSGNLFVDLAKKNVLLKGLQLSSGELAIHLDAELSDYSAPVFKGKLRVPEFSLAAFLTKNRLPQPVWKNDTALQQVGFSCEFSGSMKEITVSVIDVLLDGAHGTGDFVLVDPSHPAYDFTMHFDRLDFDSYATVVPEIETVSIDRTKEGGQVQASKIESGAVPIKKASSLQAVFPVESLRKLQFTVDLSVDAMKIKGLELAQVKLKASGKDGQLQLQPFQAKLYDGSITAAVNLDVQGKLPHLAVKGNIDHVQIGPLLKDITGKEEVTGAAVLTLDLTTKGNVKEQLIRHANGRMELALQDGVVTKLHLLEVVRQAKAIYEKQPLVQTAKDEPTGFARIHAIGIIKNGIFENSDLKGESDLLKVTGSGKVDFVNEYVDYLLKVSILRGLDRDQKSGTSEYSKFVIPYRIKGKFSNIKEEADVVELFKAEATSLLLNELQKQLKIDKQSGEENSTRSLIEQGLKGLFGN